MVDVARFFMEFCMDESCGKCIPCRAGTVQMHDLLSKITRGEATTADLKLLEELCDMVRHTSLCGLGQTAPNPVLEHAALLPRRVREPHCRSDVPGRRLCDAAGAIRGGGAVSVKTLTINGKPVSAREDETILEAAREHGITIPTLCHLDGLSDVGACRLCLVEVTGAQAVLPRLRHDGRPRAWRSPPTRRGCRRTAG